MLNKYPYLSFIFSESLKNKVDKYHYPNIIERSHFVRFQLLPLLKPYFLMICEYSQFLKIFGFFSQELKKGVFTHK